MNILDALDEAYSWTKSDAMYIPIANSLELMYDEDDSDDDYDQEDVYSKIMEDMPDYFCQEVYSRTVKELIKYKEKNNE